MDPYFLEQSPPHYQSQPNKKELSKSDSPNARPYENNFYHSFYLKLCLLIFSKNKKCRHIKVLNTPENDDELKKVPTRGVEPPTFSLRGRCSTS